MVKLILMTEQVSWKIPPGFYRAYHNVNFVGRLAKRKARGVNGGQMMNGAVLEVSQK